MKGEYLEDKDHPNNMFSKLHHQQQQQQQQTHKFQQPLHHHHHQHFRECQTSEEANSQSPNRAATDGATIEVVRRPRGRPPGSKNKPKPPVIITRDTEPSMSPYVLELSGGADIDAAVFRFCRRRNIGICVLSGSGTVANVTLRQPSSNPGATVTFHGRFDILSLSATILPNTASSSGIPDLGNGFTISLAGPQGQIVGGSVVGPLVAAGTVYIVAASFSNPSYHRLPLPAEDDMRNSSVSGGNNEGQSPPTAAVSGGGDGGHTAAGTTESCGMSMYHLPSDVIWAPTARQPPPPPY